MLRLSGRAILSSASKCHVRAVSIPSTRSTSTDSNPYMNLSKGKVERGQFIKDLFSGRFDKRFLTFPEVLDKEQIESINSMHDAVAKYFEDKVDSAKLDETEIIPDDVMNGLRELGLFGQQIEPDYGGLGLNATEYVRLNEAISDGSLTTTLMAHNSIGIKGIIMYGNEQQKRKYLPKIASGEYIASFALTEPNSGSDAASITTSVRLSEDGKHYIMNGQKLYITNGGFADVMTVFAKNESLPGNLKPRDTITAFIVEKKFGGITTGKAESKLGIKASNTVPVFFENCKIPVENVLDKPGNGFKVAVSILNTGRFGMGGALAGAARTGLKMTVDYVTQRRQFGKNLSEFELTQKKIAQIVCEIYAMESMSYMTTALVDNVKDADYSLEAACVKIFASEAALRICSEYIQLHGGSGFLKHLPFERAFRDCRITMIFEGTNEVLRFLVSLMGISGASKELKEAQKLFKSPLQNPGFITKKLYHSLMNMCNRPVKDLALPSEVHSSLHTEASDLEYCVKRLQLATEMSLLKYKDSIVLKQMALERLADIAIDIYAMTAVLARASRANRIQTPSAAHETEIAKAFCYDAKNRVVANAQELFKYDTENNTDRYCGIAKEVFQKGKFFALHPIDK